MSPLSELTLSRGQAGFSGSSGERLIAADHKVQGGGDGRKTLPCPYLDESQGGKGAISCGTDRRTSTAAGEHGADYQRLLGKAIVRTSQLLIREVQSLDAEKVHSVKSILYAAIERVGLESERLTGVQKMLRDLLVLTTIQGSPVSKDREEALVILSKLSRHLYR